MINVTPGGTTRRGSETWAVLLPLGIMAFLYVLAMIVRWLGF